MNLANVKALNIPEGSVKAFTADDTIMWTPPQQELPINPEFQIISGKFKTAKANVGKVATLGVSVTKGHNITNIHIVSDLGRVVELTKFVVSTRPTDKDSVTAILPAVEEDIGERTYTYYIISGNGYRTAEATASIEIIS
ncbi:MAG: hypothetical protein IJY28_10920 [Clostridia bacterium]|nr:hypothetical protein [Clostridia bacterium]